MLRWSGIWETYQKYGVSDLSAATCEITVFTTKSEN